MITAKIIRHRHTFKHEINGTLRGIDHEDHYKIVFSDPQWSINFTNWLADHNGIYKWDYETQKVSEVSNLPGEEGLYYCWCDVFSHFLSANGFSFHSALSPYKGEVYVK